MSRFFGAGRVVALVMLMGLTACGGSNRPPSKVTDACLLKAERPHWYRAMTQTERKWGVPVSVQMATIARESSFKHDARPMKRVGSSIFARNVPRSSALGYSQAIDSTWDWYKRETGRRFASRKDFADSTDFIGWYMNRNTQIHGIHPADAYNHYLAYHEGTAGYGRGSYRRKSWLPAVARDVQAWSYRYAGQLQGCS